MGLPTSGSNMARKPASCWDCSSSGSSTAGDQCSPQWPSRPRTDSPDPASSASLKTRAGLRKTHRLQRSVHSGRQNGIACTTNGRSDRAKTVSRHENLRHCDPLAFHPRQDPSWRSPLPKHTLLPPEFQEAATRVKMSPAIASCNHVFLAGTTGSDAHGHMPAEPKTLSKAPSTRSDSSSRQAD